MKIEISLMFNNTELARYTKNGANGLPELLINEGGGLIRVGFPEFRDFIEGKAYLFIRSKNREIITEYNKFCEIAL